MKLNAKQILLCELLADFTDKRTKEQKAVAAGFAKKYVYAFEKRLEVAELVYTTLKRNLAKELPGVYGAVYRSARKNAGQDARTYFQAAGEIQSGTNVSTTVVQNNEGSFADRLQEAQAARNERARDLRRIALEDTD